MKVTSSLSKGTLFLVLLFGCGEKKLFYSTPKSDTTMPVESTDSTLTASEDLKAQHSNPIPAMEKHEEPKVEVPKVDLGEPLVFTEGFESLKVSPGNNIIEDYGTWFVMDSLNGWQIQARDVAAPCPVKAEVEIQLGNVLVGEEPPEGQAYAELDSKCVTAISRSFTSAPGHSYKLTFSYRARDELSQASTIFIVTSTQGILLEKRNVAIPLKWEKVELIFKATTPESKLKFEDYGFSDGMGVLIDDIRLERIVSNSP